MPKNKFCKLENLRNESDVEQFLVYPMLNDLGYTADYIETKASIKQVNIGKEKRKRAYRPDYVCYSDKKHQHPVLIVDAKNPDEDPEDGVIDAQLYASVIRRSLSRPKPDQFCIGTNGRKTIIKHYDSSTTEYTLDFAELGEGIPDTKLSKMT